MNIITQLLNLDLSLLQSARWLVWWDYAYIVQVVGELIVIYWVIILVMLWLYGVYIKNNEYKKIALTIFFTIVTIFIFYAIINIWIPKWRLGAMEIPGSIRPLIPHPIDNSFPSGHALFTAALLFWIINYFRRSWLLISVICIAFLSLTARVIGGVHYPGDILGWLLIWSIGAYILRPIVTICILKVTPLCIRIASWIRL